MSTLHNVHGYVNGFNYPFAADSEIIVANVREHNSALGGLL